MALELVHSHGLSYSHLTWLCKRTNEQKPEIVRPLAHRNLTVNICSPVALSACFLLLKAWLGNKVPEFVTSVWYQRPKVPSHQHGQRLQNTQIILVLFFLHKRGISKASFHFHSGASHRPKSNGSRFFEFDLYTRNVIQEIKCSAGWSKKCLYPIEETFCGIYILSNEMFRIVGFYSSEFHFYLWLFRWGYLNQLQKDTMRSDRLVDIPVLPKMITWGVHFELPGLSRLHLVTLSSHPPIQPVAHVSSP